jgi:hypothetical protein
VNAVRLNKAPLQLTWHSEFQTIFVVIEVKGSRLASLTCRNVADLRLESHDNEGLDK